MKLYFSSGACSLSPHIVLREAGLPFDLSKVDLRAHQTADGADYYRMNPKGYVPLLELDDGQTLSEGVAIVQWIADQRPDSHLAPPAGTMERYRLQEWLTFISSEIHKTFSPLFNSKNPEEVKQGFRDKLATRFGWVETQLADRDYLLGKQFSAADAYLFTVMRWAGPTGVDLSRWPGLVSYFARVAARPRVKEALAAEGLS